MLEFNAKKIFHSLTPTSKVLDVGGWHSPFNRANTVIDIMDYDSRPKENAVLKELCPNEVFTRETFHQMDICGPKPWPFKDKEFDFAICAQTLEDIRDPIFVCSELNRVAKAGYIEVPSRLVESTKGMERPFFCGFYHHRWLCEVEGSSISFMFKPAMLHAYRQFHFRRPWFKKVNPELDTAWFFWENSFHFEEKIIIDRAEVQEDLRKFKRKMSVRPDLFVPRHA